MIDEPEHIECFQHLLIIARKLQGAVETSYSKFSLLVAYRLVAYRQFQRGSKDAGIHGDGGAITRSSTAAYIPRAASTHGRAWATVGNTGSPG